jgi:aspartyl-tRNA(Asn)/glutamyl-tRNA(Gln) amidotransferase subunit A
MAIVDHRCVDAVATAVRTRVVSAREVVAAALKRVERSNGQLNAFVNVAADAALAAADAVDRSIARGVDPGPLAGVPFGVKDLDDCIGFPTRHGSLLYADSPAAIADAPIVARLRSAGAIPIGKVAMSEFGLDNVTCTRAYGTTRNPWNSRRTPGGSSGGSAAAVAAAMVPLCTGSDGGGSIRVPAAYTGLVGLKPSHGRVPRANGFSDISCTGVITASTLDTARCLSVISGSCDFDRMTLPTCNIDYAETATRLDVRGLRVAWSEDLGFAPVESEVADIAAAAARRLIGVAELVERKVPVRLTNVYLAWALLATTRLRRRLEAEGHLPAHLELLSAGPRHLLDRWGAVSSHQMVVAEQKLLRLEREVAELFRHIDILLTPTAACEAYAAEGPSPDSIAGKDASETNAEALPVFANVCWLPSVSVPAGLTRSGLPVGLMITCRRHSDDVALRLAHLLEADRPWPLSAPASAT